MGGLAAGSYYVQFSDCLTSTRNDISQYYQNAADQTSATLVVLSSGGAKSGVALGRPGPRSAVTRTRAPAPARPSRTSA